MGVVHLVLGNMGLGKRQAKLRKTEMGKSEGGGIWFSCRNGEVGKFLGDD